MDMYKKKKSTIVSYGLIVYSFNENNTPVFVVYNRRDTFEYMDFLKGFWTHNTNFQNLFQSMTSDELRRLETYTFPELWDDLWVDHDSNIYKYGYNKASKKFSLIQDKIPQFLKKSVTNNSPPWEFPKGKKNTIHEDNLGCALREFKEETTIDTSNFKILNIPSPLCEKYKGSNGKMYMIYYYIAYSPTITIPEKVSTPQCIRKITLTSEASEVKWLTYEECLNLITSTTKKDILTATLNCYINPVRLSK